MKMPTGPEWDILKEIEISIDTRDLTLEEWKQIRAIALETRKRHNIKRSGFNNEKNR